MGHYCVLSSVYQSILKPPRDTVLTNHIRAFLFMG